jgi:hypothetical protein
LDLQASKQSAQQKSQSPGPGPVSVGNINMIVNSANSTINATAQKTRRRKAPHPGDNDEETDEGDATHDGEDTDESDDTDDTDESDTDEGDETYEGDDAQGDEADEISGSDTTIHSPLDVEFERLYSSFDPANKWQLASGTVVEEVLHRHYSEVRSNHVGNLVRDWVIDLENQTMKGWFTSEEWREIMKEVPTLQQPSLEFAKSLTRFYGVKTTTELREKVMTTRFLPEGVSYDRDIHFDLEWAELAVIDLFVFLVHGYFILC